MIQNEIDRTSPQAGSHIEMRSLKGKYLAAVHRPVGPCSTYNCHGLTFASRRTQISQPSEVAKILADDDYTEISLKNVMVGDIAIYKSDPFSGRKLSIQELLLR